MLNYGSSMDSYCYDVQCIMQPTSSHGLSLLLLAFGFGLCAGAVCDQICGFVGVSHRYRHLKVDPFFALWSSVVSWPSPRKLLCIKPFFINCTLVQKNGSQHNTELCY